MTYPRDDCGKKRDLRLAMGVSVGWDDYYWRIPGQASTSRRSRRPLQALGQVRPRNWFRESNERNNVTWVEVEITGRFVEVLRHSPRF